MPTQRQEIPIVKGDYVSTNSEYRDAIPVNLIAIVKPILGAQGYLVSHPGLTLHANASGPDRNGQWNERLAEHFRVSGNKLVTIEKDPVFPTPGIDIVGDISGDDRASLAYSFNTQAIVADGKMYLYDGITLSEVTDPDLGNPIDICWIDGYYFLTDGEFLYHTDLNNESSIDPIKFATAEFAPDPTLAVETTADNQVIVFGRYSIEYFLNRATEQFAFQRIQGKSLRIGIAGTHCETELDGRFFILGSTKEETLSVHYISSGTYEKVATREVDKILSEYTDIELKDAVLETRVDDGVNLILVRLSRHTLIYNHTIAMAFGIGSAWSFVKTGVDGLNKWRGVNGVYDPRIPAWVYGDEASPNIGRLDTSVASQYGEEVETICYTPLIDMESTSINQLDIQTLPGHQLNLNDITASVSLTYNGISYGKEWFKLYGKNGHYGTRFIINRLGYIAENVGFKVRSVSQSRVNFSKAIISYG